MIKHDQYVCAALWEKVDYDRAYQYQCVDFVRKYAELFFEKIGTFSWSALNGRKTGKPFGKKRKKVENSDDAIPPQGAIMFFDKTKENPYWHVAVSHLSNAKRVTVLEQNGGKGTGTGTWTDAVRLQTYDYITPKCLGWFVYGK